LAILATGSVWAVSHAAAPEGATSQWVSPGPDGKLVYKTTPRGDRIMDFSYAGYMGGGVALPNIPTKRTVQPTGGDDDTAAIQAAINEVAALPLENGFRGAVELAPGVFNCPTPITISASGVVLRGAGSGAEGDKRSTLKLTGRPHVAVAVRTGGPRGPRGGGQAAGAGGAQAAGAGGGQAAGGGAGQGGAQRGGGQGAGGGQGGGGGGGFQGPQVTPLNDAEGKPIETTIVDEYVPSGTMTFHVADATRFAVGDTIAISRPVTDEWVKFMQMDDLVRDGRPQTWLRVGRPIVTERRIAAIDGNTITFDVPLSDSFDAKYLGPTGASMAKIAPTPRLSQVGIEYLHIECPPQEINHTQPHFQTLRLNGEDCWVRDVVSDETMNSVSVGGRRVTIERVAVRRTAKHQGSSKPAEFAPNASQVLLDRCTVSGDNIWYSATGAAQSGPIVLLNCVFTGNGRAETHQRWSTGFLYDHCQAPGGGLDFRNRGSMGSGHGWTMGWGVAWNCEAESYIIQSPPGATNWMIGCTGASTPMPRPFGTGPLLAEGTIDSPGKPVAPQSLYLAQLAERLGPQAVKNIGY
jgi:hypothetical protein